MNEQGEKALAYLSGDLFTNSSLIQVIRRGTARLIHVEKEGILLYDTVSHVYMLSAEYGPVPCSWLADVGQACSIFTVTDRAFVPIIQKTCHLEHASECMQFVFDGNQALPLRRILKITEPTQAELGVIIDHYDLISREEILKINARHELFAGHDCTGHMVGFVGSHLEGSMGLLLVFPAYQRRGYATELECFLIDWFIQKGRIPFCQVICGNRKSEALQQKLGLKKASKKVYWFF